MKCEGLHLVGAFLEVKRCRLFAVHNRADCVRCVVARPVGASLVSALGMADHGASAALRISAA